MGHGALSRILSGAVMMHKLPAASWDTSNLVQNLYIPVLFNESLRFYCNNFPHDFRSRPVL